MKNGLAVLCLIVSAVPAFGQVLPVTYEQEVSAVDHYMTYSWYDPVPLTLCSQSPFQISEVPVKNNRAVGITTLDQGETGRYCVRVAPGECRGDAQGDAPEACAHEALLYVNDISARFDLFSSYIAGDKKLYSLAKFKPLAKTHEVRQGYGLSLSLRLVAGSDLLNGLNSGARVTLQLTSSSAAGNAETALPNQKVDGVPKRLELTFFEVLVKYNACNYLKEEFLKVVPTAYDSLFGGMSTHEQGDLLENITRALDANGCNY